MNRTLVLLAVGLSSIASGSTWDIDSDHAAAGFAVRHLMVSTVKGSLGRVTGKVELDEQDITRSSVTASIEARGVNTRNQKRDDHLRSREFLDVERFPSVTFRSVKVERGEGDEKLRIVGELTIHGVTRPVTLEAELTEEVVSPFTDVVTRAVSATTTINRRDYGLNWQVPMANNGVVVGDEVRISIEAEIMKRPAQAPAQAAPRK
jgi:polyisoprenoid-binding protein YceI